MNLLKKLKTKRLEKLVNKQLSDLFQLSTEELQLSQELAAIIHNEIIVNHGVIPFSRYMELALYYPQLGYYSNHLTKFGQHGDFVTSPMVSSMFGQLIAIQLKELFSFGLNSQILEFGAGNGRLMCDILSIMGTDLEFYYIVELSADLINLQRELLALEFPQFIDKVIWLNELPSNFNGVILANEVLDAQPCDLVRFNAGQISGVGVSYDSQAAKFSYLEYPLAELRLNFARQLNLSYNDYITEISLSNAAFIRSLSHILAKGAILLIDYGYGQNEYYHEQRNRGTLRGFYRQHLLDDVLIYPGIIDITASVNWSLIAQVALDSDLELIGYTSQANFLLNCGLIDQLERLREQATQDQYLMLSNQVNRLISPNEMGDLFKVMGFSKGLTQDSWCGFKSNDRSYLL